MKNRPLTFHVSRFTSCRERWIAPNRRHFLTGLVIAHFWGAGPSEGPNRVAINADGWKRWLTQIQNANLEVNSGNLKGRISRNLSGLLAGPDPPDMSWAPWSETELSCYAHQLCQYIDALGLRDYVGAWYLDDEGLKHLWYSTCTVTKAAEIIHGVQKQYGPTGNRFNFPFHISEDITIFDGQTDTHGTRIPDENLFWKINRTTNKWEFQVPPTLKARIDAFLTGTLSDAKVIFLPFFYPWGNASDAWRYRKHVVNDAGVLNTLLPDNPPWMNWKTAMDKLREVFPPAQYPLSKLEFQVFTDASKQGELYPRHVDLHKAIRVLLNLRKHWLDLGDTRFTGIWFMGWKKTGNPSGEAAHLHWTQTGSLRYAEAIQNEVGAGTEALTDVWKDDTGNLIANRIVSVLEDVSKAPPPTIPPGQTARAWRIAYRLSPSTVMRPQGAPGALVLGSNFILGKRHSFTIEIVRVSDGVVVHTIDEGYIYPFQCYANISPHARYEEGVSTQGANLRGTSAYWDGLWDNGALDGKPAGAGTYRAYLVINGTRLTGAGDYIDFV